MFKTYPIALSLFILTGSLSLIFSLPADSQSGIKIRGNCESQSCEQLWKRLGSNFPEKIQKYQRECLLPNTIGLDVSLNTENQKVVFLNCWEPQRTEWGYLGHSLGVLPVPGYEAEFGARITIVNDQPKIQAALNRNPEQVKRMRFECGTQGGTIYSVVSEDEKVSLVCNFQFLSTLVDEDGDFVADGMMTRGNSLDFTEELKN